MWWMVGLAFAQGAAEAANPCPNGWVSCEVEGVRLGPAPMHDSQGFPALPGARMAFLSLEPTPLFSPFTGVSYPEEKGLTVPTEPTVPDEVLPTDPPEEPDDPEQPEPEHTPETAPAPTPSQPVPAPQAVAVAPRPTPKPAPEPDDAVAMVEEVEPVVAVPVSCELNTDLEGRASIGRLSAGEKGCLLKRRDAGSTAQTERSALSRVLLADALAKGDIDAQASLLSHHLAKIDQSDPDLCMHYAKIQGRKGRYAQGIRWADTALENRDSWSGPNFVKTVSGVYKFRAGMANRLWQRRAEDIGTSVEKDEAAEQARALTKTLAREWLDYVRSAGVDDSVAMELCVSAAGSRKFCKD